MSVSALLLFCSVLSNITINSSWTTTSNVTQANLLKGVAIASLNQNSAGQKEQFTGAYSLEDHKQIAQNEPDLSSNSTSSESSPEINRFWFLIAMAVTSTVYLWLIWILFKKPLPKNEVVSALANAKEQSDEQKVLDDLPAFDSVKEMEGISDLEQALVDPSQDEPPLAQTNISIVGKADPKSNPKSNLVTIDSESNYIDVGLELIQDLQHSDRNIRRKAIWELAKIGDYRCIEPLMAIMPQASAVDKSLIQKAFTQITNRSFKPLNEQLFASLKDANPQVRINAILDLTAFYKFVAPINQQLSRMQRDPDPEVRHCAQQVSEKFNLTNFPASVPMINNYPGHSHLNQNGKMASENKDKANQI